MAVIKVKKITTDSLIIPNCFCGSEPEVYTERQKGDNRYAQVLWIECPYCGAHSPIKKAFDLDSINSRYGATKECAEAWSMMIEAVNK